MKSKIVGNEDNNFKPFQLIIDIESDDDLNDLFARFNVAFVNNCGYKNREVVDDTLVIYRLLKTKCQERWG